MLVFCKFLAITYILALLSQKFCCIFCIYLAFCHTSLSIVPRCPAIDTSVSPFSNLKRIKVLRQRCHRGVRYSQMRTLHQLWVLFPGQRTLYKGVSCFALSSTPFILAIIFAYFLFFLFAYLCFPGNFHLFLHS